MIALKLVHLIEAHSEQLAHGLMHKVESSPKCAGMSKVPREEFQQRAFEIYHNLSEWLLNTTEHDIERTYKRVGMRRAEQGVPFADFLWAIVITREHLWDFVQFEGVTEKPIDMLGALELVHIIQQFFDRAMYYGWLGYESVVAREEKRERAHAA